MIWIVEFHKVGQQRFSGEVDDFRFHFNGFAFYHLWMQGWKIY